MSKGVYFDEDECIGCASCVEICPVSRQFAPPVPEEKDIRAKLAKSGVGPGKSFNFKDLSLKHKLGIGLGMKEGEKKVEEKVAGMGKRINGWLAASARGNRDFLPRRLAAARRRGQGRHLRQRCDRGHISPDYNCWGQAQGEDS